jgi:hypothetical protein
MIAGLYARGHGQAMGNSWADPETTHSCGEATPLVSDRVLGADDGTRTRDPHLGNFMVVVSCVSVGLSSAPELHLLGALVSCVSPDRWSGLDFVGDFVGASGDRTAPADVADDGDNG